MNPPKCMLILDKQLHSIPPTHNMNIAPYGYYNHPIWPPPLKFSNMIILKEINDNFLEAIQKPEAIDFYRPITINLYTHALD